MNVVNRVVIVVLLLVAIPLCTLLFVLPLPTLGVVEGQAAGLLEFIGRLRLLVRLPLGALFAMVLDIILVLLIILEVRRPAPRAIRVEQAAGGEVTISVASIADRLKYEIDQLTGVLRSEPKVSTKRGGVVVEVDVETAAEIDVPGKAERIVETARQVVEDKMGLKLARPPKVRLRAAPHPRRGEPSGGPPALQEE